jgi:hypothetical protein
MYLIFDSKLTAIYCDIASTFFYTNGYENNIKNASYISKNDYKEFSLNGKCYGNKYNFTKQSWRRFVKLQAFL